MKIDTDKVTPMMRQYLETKQKYSDCILFFRLGDFYEMFFDDAILASRVLEIALTGKSCGLEERAPMCGVPYHSASTYISRLIEKGYKVAIGEQVEDPKLAKGLVKREVVRVITPGTVLEENSLENKKNNYLMSIYVNDTKDASVSYVDITTGELNSTKIEKSKIIHEISKIMPSEIIVNDELFLEEIRNIANMANIYLNEEFNESYLNNNIINKYFEEEYLYNLDLNNNGEIGNSLSILLNYIYNTQKVISSNISRVNIYTSSDFMVLDMFTRNNLELTETIRGSKKKGSLLYVLDKTHTAMGGRMLRKYIEEPLVKKKQIEYRLNIIEELVLNFNLRADLKENLSKIYDIERICGKIAYDKVTPKELVSLKNSIEMIPNIVKSVEGNINPLVYEFVKNIDKLEDVYKIINDSIKDDAPMSIKDGGIIKDTYDEELKSLRDICGNGASIIKEIEKREREKTGIKTLKIGYNRVFGYYIEITKAAIASANLSEEYTRKQTLANAERYITIELKEIEDKILNAEDKIKILEHKLFAEVRCEIYENISRLQMAASKIAILDVYLSFAEVAIINNYSKPQINENNILEIKEGRHPVIESIIGEENFISNDTYINNKDNIINIITGPNMSGKSTYMRQAAIIALMAHMGAFVPAKVANIPIMDRIFTRVGASDDLSQGQSTFMVEMNEVSQILKNATKNSLIILDEIGRGTSTYDGISLAWSIVEYIHDNICAMTLFATHYHELTEMENKFKKVKNYSVKVNEEDEKVVFLRKIIPQPADKSYGIYVAKLAKVPDVVINRAEEILVALENKNFNKKTENVKVKIENKKDFINDKPTQMSFEIQDKKVNEKKDILIDKISNVDVLNTTPMDIIKIFCDLQKDIKNIEK